MLFPEEKECTNPHLRCTIASVAIAASKALIAADDGRARPVLGYSRPVRRQAFYYNVSWRRERYTNLSGSGELLIDEAMSLPVLKLSLQRTNPVLFADQLRNAWCVHSRLMCA